MKRLYSIYDQKTRNFEPPFMAANDEAAQRSFNNIVQGVPLMKNTPEDFDLYYIGVFSEETALIEPVSVVQKIINGLSFTEIPTMENSNETTKVGDDSPVQPST